MCISETIFFISPMVFFSVFFFGGIIRRFSVNVFLSSTGAFAIAAICLAGFFYLSRKNFFFYAWNNFFSRIYTFCEFVSFLNITF